MKWDAEPHPFFIFGQPMKMILETLNTRLYFMRLLYNKKIKSLLSIFAIFFFTFSCLHANAQKAFDFNANCQQAYKEITSLRLDAGLALLSQERQQNPDNLIPDLLEEYVDFFTLFFNEDPAQFDALVPKFSERLDRLEEGPENSPFYLYSRAILYMQKASVEIKFSKTWSAGWDFKKAFGLIKENRKKFPSFTPNNMVYAPMLVVAGTIPDGYKWLASLFGIKGSIQDGMKIMVNFVNSDDPMAKLFFNEASFYYCYILFYIENEQDKVFDYINDRNLDLKNNQLLTYMAANLAINAKKTDYAESVIKGRNQSSQYLKTPVWDFEMGYIKLHQLQLNEAATYFQRFLDQFKGKFYVKDCYEKLAWCYYLLGNTSAANNARQLVLSNGNTMTDADKQANKDAKSGIWPNTILLKARILSDGGYHTEALKLLAGKSARDFSRPEDKLEFAYRVGRIYDDLGRDNEAVQMYLLAINLGQGRTEYFAARAALQIGYIYEEAGQTSKAIEYFKKCIGMKDHEYKDSLDQKAKAGIARCLGQ